MNTLAGLTVDRVDRYAVALPTIRSSGVSGGAVAGTPSIRRR
ncbi:hypothetical protein [Micromonospora sp. WMMD998]|nr:hypothetical protein [Micromonospora sp. WMMD998]WFE40269.1 hypothetical protein O7619_18210 [Micromonospora sp. WMMD998]